MQRRTRAPGGGLPRRRIAGRECLAETARADAVERMRARHAQRRAPDPGAAGQRHVDPFLVRGHRVGGALDALAHLRREHHQGRHHHGAEGEHAQQLLPAEQAPAGEQQHQPVGDPRSARTGQQHDDADRGGGDDPAERAEPARGGIQRERRQAGQHDAELEVARAEHAAEPVHEARFFRRAHAVAADRLLDRVDAVEQRAGPRGRLHQRVQGPHADDDPEPGEGGAPRTRSRHRRRHQPQERQVAQVDQRLLQRARMVHRIGRGERLGQPVGEEQHAGQRPGRAAEQLHAATEARQQQPRDGRQRTEHHHAFGIARCRPQRDEGQHPGRRPAPALGACGRRRGAGSGVSAGWGRGQTRLPSVRDRWQVWPAASPAACSRW